MSTAQHAKAWRDKNKQSGLCPYCGKKVSIDGKRCEDCAQKTLESNRRQRQERYNKGLCVKCGKNSHYNDKKYCSLCLEKQRTRYHNSGKKQLQLQRALTLRRERRHRILKHYGGVCICCGEAELMFLSLDHIEGGGNEHRRQIGNNPNSRGGSSSTQFAKWVETNNYPDILQILCHNCNMGRYLNGGICPHKDRVKLPSDELDYNPVPPNKTFTQKTRYVYEGEGKP